MHREGEKNRAMAMEKFVGIGTNRTTDVFQTLLELLEVEKPSVIALDQNPIWFSTLIQMRSSRELFNERFILDQQSFLLKRQLGVGNSAGILYSFRHGKLPLYFVDGSFQEPLSDTGEEIGIYPYFTSVDFAASVDLMRVPINLRKQRIPTYPGWDFEYDLIHAYQTDTKFQEMDRAIWQRNQFTSQAINRIMQSYDRGVLAYIGHRKRFSFDLYRQTEGIGDRELAEYRPLVELVLAGEKVVFDTAAEIPG
ncbi:MAG: hypothetical protein ACLFVT_02320 [Syntrophobacteria bacterium]